MKTKKLLIILATVGTLAASIQPLRALGTAFGYEGQLIDSGTPATGLYDYTFTLYDASSGETLLVLKPAPVPTTNGLFVVSLNFGPGIFTGPDYWLDVNVRTNGSITFTDLGRTALSATPYALYTLNAQVAASVAASSVTGANIKVAAITATNIASGQVVRSIDGFEG